MATIAGYVRVSTKDQRPTGQLDALKAGGTIYKERVSGVRADRPQLANLMASLKEPDVVPMTKLDRLGRSTRELLDLIERIVRQAPRSGRSETRSGTSQGWLLSTRLAGDRRAGEDFRMDGLVGLLSPRQEWFPFQTRYVCGGFGATLWRRGRLAPVLRDADALPARLW